jgi:hypothetical protein
MTTCQEPYGSRDPDKAKICMRMARVTIHIDGGLVLYRCGIHARWYRTHGAKVIDVARHRVVL